MSTESGTQAGDETPADFAAAFAEATQAGTQPSEASAEPGSSDDNGGTAGENLPAPALTGAPEAGSDSDADDATNAPSLDKQPSDTDIWATAPEHIRSAFEAERQAWETKLTGAKGRAAGLQRKLDESLRQQQAAQAKEPEVDPTEVLASDEIKKLREDYGEIADPLLKLVQPLVDKINRLEGRVQTVDDTTAASHEAAEIARLESVHADWKQVLNANEDVFTEWLGDQPRHIREAFERNVVNLTDADEAIDVVGRFKQYLTANVDPQHQQLGAKRVRQLAAGQSVKTTAAPTASSQVPDDFEAGFAAASR